LLLTVGSTWLVHISASMKADRGGTVHPMHSVEYKLMHCLPTAQCLIDDK